jgi:hypothetical protein
MRVQGRQPEGKRQTWLGPAARWGGNRPVLVSWHVDTRFKITGAPTTGRSGVHHRVIPLRVQQYNYSIAAEAGESCSKGDSNGDRDR